MNWIMENWGMISAITTPALLFCVGIALKKVPKKYQSDLLKIVQAVEQKMIEADYLGDDNITHNDDIKDEMEKIKIELGVGK